MNKVILHGNCGKDPESRKVNEKTVTKFSLATNKTYSNNVGEKITDTSWHNIVLWGKVAETASKYVKKGMSIIIEGEINYRSYENKEGQTVYITEIIGQNMHFTGNKEAKEPKEEIPQDDWKGKKEVKSMSDISELPGNVADYNDIPDDDKPF
jgi:single-strand DNA-binding protein